MGTAEMVEGVPVPQAGRGPRTWTRPATASSRAPPPQRGMTDATADAKAFYRRASAHCEQELGVLREVRLQPDLFAKVFLHQANISVSDRCIPATREPAP